MAISIGYVVKYMIMIFQEKYSIIGEVSDCKGGWHVEQPVRPTFGSPTAVRDLPGPESKSAAWTSAGMVRSQWVASA